MSERGQEAGDEVGAIGIADTTAPSDEELLGDTDQDFNIGSGDEKNRRILVVDDELHILKAVRRLFMDRDYVVLTAQDAEQALDILERGPVAVVVSDQRMPGLSGSELLNRVRKKYPKTVRIMLTGNNDVSTAVEAINDGEVFRFVTKPWDHDNFLRMIDLALEQYDLLNSKERYERQIERQNQELRQFNERLEQKVAERTKEVEAQKREIRCLYGELQDSFDGMIKALLCVMELGEIHVVEHCRRTAERCRIFGEFLEMKPHCLRHLERAALLHWIGLTQVPVSFFHKSMDELDAAEAATWEFHPLLGQQAIQHVPELEQPARVILHYLRRYDDPAFSPGQPSADEGQQPLDAEFIRTCQVLGICSSFEQARLAADSGAKAANGKDRYFVEQGLERLDGERGKRFDPELVDKFGEMLREQSGATRSRKKLVSFEILRPGMVLANPVETVQGIPVAPRDMVITDKLLERLERFHDSNGLSEIYVWE